MTNDDNSDTPRHYIDVLAKHFDTTNYWYITHLYIKSQRLANFSFKQKFCRNNLEVSKIC